MNVIIEINNEIERENMRNSLMTYDCISDVIIAESVDDAILKMKNVEFDKAVLSIDSQSKDLMYNLVKIKEIKSENPKVKIFILTDKTDESFSSAATIFDIDQVFVEPYDTSDVIEKVVEYDYKAAGKEIDESKKVSIERMTSSILSSTGILPNLKGYKYLKEAIVTGYTRRETLDAVTKYLYPEIAGNNHTTADRVERAIRHAIESAWSKCNGNGFYNKMGFGNAYNGKRPTNSEYIFAVVEYLNNHIS